MRTQKAWLIILALGLLLLAAGGDPAQARPPVQRPDPPVRAGSAPDRPGTGGPIGTGWFPISWITNEAGHYAEEYPAVAYNSQWREYLVVWDQYDGAGGNYIYGQFVSRSGALIDSRFLVPGSIGVNGYPDVAYNPARNEYLVVYEFGPFPYGIYGQRLNADGTPAGTQLYFASSTTYSYQHAAVAYATNSSAYLVVWQKNWGTAFKGIEARSLSSDGTTMGSVLEVTGLLANVEPSAPDVAYNSARDQCLIVWQKWYDSSYSDHDIYGQRVDMDGGAHLEGYPFGIHASTDDEVAPAVGAVAQPADVGKYLVVCERGYPGGPAIDGRLVTGNGTLDPYVRISPSLDGRIPAVAGNEGTQEYLVAWQRGSTEIQARTVSVWGYADGSAYSFPGRVPSHPAVAGGPSGNYLVTCDDAYLSGYPYDVLGWRWGYRVLLPLILRQFP